MQVITVTVAFSMPTRKLVTIKVTFLRVCLFGAHLQFLIPVTVRDPSQVMSAIFGRDGRLLTKFLCLPDTLICLSRIYQARKGCLICMRRIDQSWKRCLICLSRIEQADRATWFAWTGFLVLLLKSSDQPNYGKNYSQNCDQWYGQNFGKNYSQSYRPNYSQSYNQITNQNYCKNNGGNYSSN